MATATETRYFAVKQGDTSPPLSGQLLDATGRPIPLNPSDTIRFRMRSQIPGVNDGVDHVGAASDLATGKVFYQWQPGDTDIPGLFDAEFYIDRLIGGRLTIPTRGYITVEVIANATGQPREMDSISVRVN